MKYNFRKIASILASALMVGSSVGLAAAAYPAPFVKGGAADVAIVMGSQAQATDYAVAIDVVSKLQAELASETAVTGPGSTTTASGDYIVLAKQTDNLNLRDVVSTVFGTTVSKSDLPVLLADGTYRNGENSDFDYEQRITLGTGLVLNFFANSDYKDRMPTIGINLTSGQLLMNYSLDFTNDAESDVSGGRLVDLETTALDLMGKQYYISRVDNSTLDITLLDTANTGMVSEGETKTVTVGNQTYDVSISFVDSTSTELTVNGETTNSLEKGGTFKLSDGTYVGIKNILYNGKDSGISKVEFSIGSGKLKLRNGQTIEVNDNSVQDVTSEIVRGTASGGKEKIDRINLVWTTQDNTFITPDTELVMPGLSAIKFSMGAFNMGTAETTEVIDGASDYMLLKTTIKDGDISLPLLYANASGNFVGVGKSASEKLVTSKAIATILYNYTSGDRMMIASWNSTNNAESHLIRFVNFINDNGVNKTTLEVYKGSATGWVESRKDLRAADTVTLGSLTLTINSVSPYNDRTVSITGNAGSSFRDLYTASGLKVFLPVNVTLADVGGTGAIVLNDTTAPAGQNSSTFNLAFAEEDKNDNVAAGNRFNVTLNHNSNSEVEVSGITTGRSTFTDPDDNNHVISYVYSDLATKVELNGQSSDQRHATVTYSSKESYADLVLTGKSSAVSSSGGGSGTVTQLGSVTVKDSEVTSVSSKNLLVIGGSCVNTVAAKMLGSDTALCGADFTTKTGAASGQYVIWTIASPYAPSKVATLVAGYDAGDTTKAGTFLTQGTVDASAGKKYLGTTATSATLQTS